MKKGLDKKKYPVIYSVGTQLAYNINKIFYNNIHYVWCTTEFHNINQPPTSDPLKICRTYLDIVSTGDRHAYATKSNLAGILRGAKIKCENNIITEEQYNDIRVYISAAQYESFFPVLYIIHTEKVKNKCKEVPIEDRASDESVEYLIEDLKSDEFDLIPFHDVLNGNFYFKDKGVGH